MGTTSEKLTYLKETKNAIKTALTNKGEVVSDSVTFRSYADIIENMSVLTDETLKYFLCNINPKDKTITLYQVFYDKIYEDTGSYDFTVPDMISGYSVIVKSE